MSPSQVVITDVTLREYGQNIPARYLDLFSPKDRTEVAQGLIDAGVPRIEIFSCVHPGIAPAMNREALLHIAGALGRVENAHLITLVPNLKGFDQFLSLGLGPETFDHTLGVFFSAVEEHNRLNLGKSIPESLSETGAVLERARSRGIRAAGYVSAAFGFAPPHGTGMLTPPPEAVNRYVDFLLERGVAAVTLSDLQGVADEEQTASLLSRVIGTRSSAEVDRLGYHPHHVHGSRALANTRAAYALGIRRFDGSLGGTGGCVTGAPGNQPTEGLIRLFEGLEVETGIDSSKITRLSRRVTGQWYDRIPLSPPDRPC